MRQVLQNLRTGVLEVRDVPAPTVRPGTLLVATSCSLISAGTEKATVRDASRTLLGKAMARPEAVHQVIDSIGRDGIVATMTKVADRLSQPKPLGYSASGTVVKVGAGVEGFRPGEQVACGGGEFAHHAEQIVVPLNLCARVPPGVLPEDACFATVGAIALQAIRRAGLALGESVAIIGMGLIGQLAARLAKAAGVRVFGIDCDPAREDASRAGGVEAFLVSSRDPVERVVTEMTQGRGVDAVVVAASTASAEPIDLAAALCRDRGAVVVVGSVGMQVPREGFYRKELDLRLSRSYGPGRYDPDYEVRGNDYPYGYVRWTEGRNLECVLDLMGRGVLEVASIRTHAFPIEEAARAYGVLSGDDAGRALGVVLTYPAAVALEAARIVAPGISARRDHVVRENTAARSSAGSGTDRSCAPVASRPNAASNGTLGVGLIGAGQFARSVLLPLLRRCPGVELRGVANATGVTAERARSKFRFAFASADPVEVLEDGRTQAVIVATRHDQHARLAVESLKRGRTVFVEKPLALSPEELDEVLLAASDGPGLMVGYNRRFAPLVEVARRHLSGESGPWMITCRVNAGPLAEGHWLLDPVQGGGRIVGEGCHFVDLANALVGAPPTSVYARASGERGLVREAQTVAATLSYPDGSICTLLYLAVGDPAVPKERIEMARGAASALIDDFRLARLWRGGRRRTVRAIGRDKGHRAELYAFLDALREGRSMPIPLDQIEGASRATFAILDSLRTGGPVALARGGAV